MPGCGFRSKGRPLMGRWVGRLRVLGCPGLPRASLWAGEGLVSPATRTWTGTISTANMLCDFWTDSPSLNACPSCERTWNVFPLGDGIIITTLLSYQDRHDVALPSR